MILTPNQFTKELSKWYEIYKKANPDYFLLEERLTQKARVRGYLDMGDLIAITQVLGNPYNIRGKIQKYNTPSEINEKTRKAIQSLDNPAEAFRNMRSISKWGLAYASKTLRCVCPSKYVALDSKLHEGIDRRYFPCSNEIERYIQFLKFCDQIQRQVSEAGPRNGEWFLADIEIALWQFVWNNGRII